METIVANSKNVQGRISRIYGRDAEVICPPVDTSRFYTTGYGDFPVPGDHRVACLEQMVCTKKLEYDPARIPRDRDAGAEHVLSRRQPCLAGEFVGYHPLGRIRSEGLRYASNGDGSPNHLLGELFRQRAGIKLLHVPYKGSNESNADVKSGRVDFMFDGSAISWVNAGQLKALAVAFPNRWPTQASIPTMAEPVFRT